MTLPTLGPGAPIDVDRLIESRMLVQASSGGGKSWVLRRLLEQTRTKVQQIVLDPEGEFFTLREVGDYVLAGKHGGDCPAEPRGAALLARRLLELGVSAVVDIFELPPHERRRFVRLFLESMVNAPRDLWHPCLVVVDEAHDFCPENAKAESAAAVVDLMARGRKRGFCGVLATQRISKLSKDAAAEASNKLIGLANLDSDRKRAADELGWTRGDDQLRLRQLEPGHFFAFGPALSRQVAEVHVGPVTSTHPKAGQRAAPPTPPRERVRGILAQLADLPREAEEEARSLADARRRIADLERQLGAKPKPPEPPAPKVERVEVPVLSPKEKAALDGVWGELTALSGSLPGIADSLDRLRAEVAPAIAAVKRPAVAPPRPSPTVTAAATRPAPRPVSRERAAGHEPGRNGAAPAGDRAALDGPEQRILDAIAWLESCGIDAPEQGAVAWLSGYSGPENGAYKNPRARLNTAGHLVYLQDGRIRLTESGRELARAPAAPATPEELQARVLDRLPGPERKILTLLIEAYPASVDNDTLARAAGYSDGNNGAYKNPRSRLRSLGLADYPEQGKVAARAVLFLEGSRA